MKGIVFTEFFDMVEKEFGYDVVDHIIEKSDLASNGVYTAVGTYPHTEIVQLLMNLSKKVEMDPQVLLKEFGKYLFDTFLKSYPQFFDEANDSFEFLHSIDSHIHVEVAKLYPDAALPRFETTEEENKMSMIYRSERKMASLAEGLLEKTMTHFGDNSTLQKNLLKEDGTVVEFIIEKK